MPLMNEYQIQKLLRNHAGLGESELADLNHEAVKTESSLEQVVERRGLLPANRLYELLARELGLPYIDLANFIVEPELIQTVPADIARRLHVIPLYRVGNTLTIATATPEDVGAIDELRQQLKLDITSVLADPASLEHAVVEHYGRAQDASVNDAIVELEAGEAIRYLEREESARSIEELAGEAPVVRFVNTIVEQALIDHASDIHIEPEESGFRVRQRVDGMLHVAGDFPALLHAAVVSRVKILAGMDISDKRRPQDGRFDIRSGGRQLDVRVSTFPTVNGENLVLRLLDKTDGGLHLDRLGLAPGVADAFERMCRQPHGMILVTGPTGSGKSTTLYSVLNILNTTERHIITLEDPVEYRLSGIRQCQVNPKAGITFASGLRSILRQDPDVIMVGEMRDSETAEIAFQAALTGHLVLSTLHTNDAAGTLTRLLDMQTEPFLISSSVIGILAQRLLRRNCDRCTEHYQPAPEVLERLGWSGTPNPGTRFRRGAGCPACGRRGFRGRIGVYELMPMSPAVRRMVMERRSAEEIRSQAVDEGMATLRDDARAKACSGVTTPEEALRVTQDQT